MIPEVEGGHLGDVSVRSHGEIMYSGCVWFKPLMDALAEIALKSSFHQLMFDRGWRLFICTYTRQRPSKTFLCVIAEHINNDMSLVAHNTISTTQIYP